MADLPPPELIDLAMDQFLAADLAGRNAACARLVAAHPEHAESLRRMLQHVNSAERVLDRSYPAADDALAIGDYRVVRQIGQGAFGTVFLCEQSQPVVRQVAVKVLRPGVGDRHTLLRFDAERQLLASLSHPAITHVYDAGCVANGRPYFVMEYVQGLPIAEHCRRAELTPEQRIRLFVEVCRGVEHAHGRGVVHRDLKPANILVVTGSDGPQPKIIDFGIAKSLTGSGHLGEPMTGAGHVLGTPGYMSPEQASGTADGVDARADVFALGVVLFELLTGELPWPRDQLVPTGATPVLPSVRLSTRARTATAEAATAMRRLAARVRGDLDWIVRKATQSDRTERYLRARDLSEDLERHLAGLPVSAGPPTIFYRCAKFLRRHRTAAAALVLACVAGGGGLAFAAWRSRADAAAHYAEANRLAANLLFRANDAGTRKAPQSEGVRTALAQDALSFYEAWLQDRPQDAALRTGRCNALMTLSRVHHTLGQAAAALTTAELASGEAAALRLADADDPAHRSLLAEASRAHGRALQLAGRTEEAGPWLQRAVADLEHLARLDANGHILSLSSALREWGGNQLVLRHLDGALAAHTQSVAVLEDMVSRAIRMTEARSELVMARVALAMSQSATGRHAEAEASMAAAEAGLPDVLVDAHRATAVVLAQQGRSAARRGDAASAIPKFEQAVTASEQWRAQEPRQFQAFSTLLESWRGLAAIHEQRAQWADADHALARVVAVREQMVAAFPQRAARVEELEACWYDSARTLWYRYRRQDLARARAWTELLLASRQQRAASQPSARPFVWECLSLHASLADADGEASDGAWDRVAEQLASSGPPRETGALPHALEAWLGVARSKLRRGDVAGARAALQHTVPLLEAEAISDDFRSQAEVVQARLHLAERDVEGAAAHVAHVVRLRPTWWGHWQAGECEREAALVLQANGAANVLVTARCAAAAAHHRAVIDALTAKVVAAPDDPWQVVPWGLASLGLAEVQHAEGDPIGALALLDAALPKLAGVADAAHCDVLDRARLAAAHALRRQLAGDLR